MATDWFPLWLSLRVAAVATLLSLAAGLWAGWWLAKPPFRGRTLLHSAVNLPLVLPPTVLGYYLLVLLGQNSPIGRFYEWIFGAPLLFTWQAAVVAAFLYSAPLVAQSVRLALESLDPHWERAAQSLGATGWSVFAHITLPLTWRPVLAAAVLAFARSLGEFGVTLMIAGNLPGRTQTLAVAVYDATERGQGAAARMLVLVISAAALAALWAAGRLSARQAV